MKSNCPTNGSVRNDIVIDWQWADGHMQAIAEALAACSVHIIRVETASVDADLRKATDLRIVADAGDVAVRVRRPGYLARFGDFTLRSWRYGCGQTELQKIRDGYGDWYLYAWSDGNGGLEDWIFIDLNELRDSGLLQRNLNEIANRGGQTRFVNFSRPALKMAGCLKAKKGNPYLF